jgi:hypothetical protein
MPCLRSSGGTSSASTMSASRSSSNAAMFQRTSAASMSNSTTSLIGLWRWKGVSLPYRVFSKDQRVSHTAVVENKRLGHALAIVKAQQDLKLATTVMTNSENTGYKKRGRKVYGSLEASSTLCAPLQGR